jgi:hypothetical protein
MDEALPPVSTRLKLLRISRLFGNAPRIAWRIARNGMPSRSLLFGPLSIGDDLLCTTVLHEARRREEPFAMFTARPELFTHNPDPLRLLPIDEYYIRTLQAAGRAVIKPYYVTADPKLPHRDVFPPRHILAEMCRVAGIRGHVTLRPYVYLTKAERERGHLAPRTLVVQSTAASAAIPFTTKEWGAAKFAAVLKALDGEFTTVQIGCVTDPVLPVAYDLRGRTTLRETAAVLANGTVFLGLEGFLVHLARAVDCVAVALLGGRVAPEYVGYSSNINFYSPIECAPCGLRNQCPHDLRCQESIPVADVVDAVRLLAERPRSPTLPADKAEVF